MIRWLLLWCTVLSAPVFGQQIGVRSGTHDGFARLVLDVPSGAQWTTDLKKNGIRLTLNQHTQGFDISNVFDRIDQTYVSTVSSDNTSLSVEFSCDCEASVFTEGQRMIVLDVRPDTKREISGLDLLFFNQSPLRFNEVESPDSKGPSEQKSEAVNDSLDSVTASNGDNALFISADNLASVSDIDRLLKAQTELSEQIGGAATRGLLTPSQEINLDTVLPKPQIDVNIFEPYTFLQDQTSNMQLKGGSIKISSSSDMQQFADNLDNTFTSRRFSCADKDSLDIQHWGSETSFSTTLADLHGALFGEFDKLNYDVAVKLVKVYLHYGFGAEAQRILQLDSSLIQSYPALVSIAEILEYGHSQYSTYFDDGTECSGPEALWVILSKPRIEPSTIINVEAALLTLSSLPMHLRKFIAPDLSRRLLAYGDEKAAAAALRSLERTPEPLSADANFAKANIEMAEGKTEQAREKLSKVVASNTEQSAEALIDFVNSYLDSEVEIEKGVATLIEAYALEMRNSPIGNELERAYVLALGKSGQFSEAFDELSKGGIRSTDVQSDTLRSSLLDLLTSSATAAEFLDHSFSEMAISPERLSAKTRFRLSERLVTLGFYEQGEVLLAIEPEYQNDREKRLLKAKITLALSRPYETLAHLFGETSEAANALRAQAEANIGKFSEAHAIYTAIGDEINSGRTAWLSGNWSTLVDEATPILGQVVRVSQNSVENSSSLEGMLGRTVAAISESESARNVIQNLLTSTDLITTTNLK